MEESATTRVDEMKAAETRFLKYTFFKLAREWRSLSKSEKEAGKAELSLVIKKFEEELRAQLFSLVGIRGDADFLVLADSKELEPFQKLVSSVLATGLGGYLDIPYSYLAMTRKSHYVASHKHPGQEGGGDERAPPTSKYIFVYPFVKKREWYGLPFAERQRIMGEHFKVGHKYPRIKINTGYSFGIDDQEFMLSFEGDDPAEFLALVEELRGTEASRYTALETPIFTCVRTDAATLLGLLG
ncbi:MAG: chlorite dismutase family protein [Thaumarchaeota archaeon]|nr:chlorite dismutase family protein [Nitrososphaerota archaeon]